LDTKACLDVMTKRKIPAPTTNNTPDLQPIEKQMHRYLQQLTNEAMGICFTDLLRAKYNDHQ
jgi:hypothetical protein